MAGSIQSFFHPQGEFLALAGSKGIDTVNAQSHMHLPSEGGTIDPSRNWPICFEEPSSFVHMVQSMTATI